MPSTTSSRRRQPALGAAALAALLLSACAKDPKPVAPAVPEVAVLTMNTSNVALNIALPGRTAPFLLAEVRARVDGIVQERRFREGADVKSGEPLYLIDPAPYRAALASAEAELQRAQATLASNTSQLKRNQVLVKENAVSKQEFENAEAAQLEAAADVAAAKAAVESARINLGYTSVSAPITGRSSVSAVTQGAYVQGSAATLMTTIQQIDPMYVDLQQSSVDGLLLRREIAAGRVRMDGANAAKVSLTLEDGSTYARSGTLEFSGVTVDQATGAVTLRARFPNPDKLLLPGMFVRAQLQSGVRQNALLVPQQGVTRDIKGQPTAMVVNGEGKVEQRILKTERTVGSDWLVTDGLKAGDKVITEGLQKIKPGATVTTKPASNIASAEQKPAGQAQ